jgi:hypothetical protein
MLQYEGLHGRRDISFHQVRYEVEQPGMDLEDLLQPYTRVRIPGKAASRLPNKRSMRVQKKEKNNNIEPGSIMNREG